MWSNCFSDPCSFAYGVLLLVTMGKLTINVISLDFNRLISIEVGNLAVSQQTTIICFSGGRRPCSLFKRLSNKTLASCISL